MGVIICYNSFMYKRKLKKTLFLFIIIFASPFFVSAKDYPDGTLIRARGDYKVYLIQGHKKSWIKSVEDFNARNFKWQKVKVISKKEVAAIKEEAVISVSASPSPILKPSIDISTPSPAVPSPSSGPSAPSPAPSPSTTPPAPAKVNSNWPAPDFIRADWLTSQITANYGRIGEKIILRYSTKDVDKIENFRLYEKKPGDKYFSRIAEFQKISSNTCEAIGISGEWMMTEAGQCGYWAIQRITPPGGRGMTAYLPAGAYSEGEYTYYVAGVDKDGFETPPSPEAKLVFLTTVSIFSPADKQAVTAVYPTFKWSLAGGWPAGIIADYSITISDDKNAPNPFWTKVLKVPTGKSDQSFTYDGFGLNPAKKYKTYIYGYYRKSESDPDYISIPLTIPEFWMQSSSQPVSLWQFLKALFFRTLAF